jgi:prepilin-type N-terminal cleavage/methylation domain-containing protein
MRALSRMSGERGFTLIEVLVTMLILMVGIFGAVALIDGASARTLANKEREGGNALTREVIEAARSVPYQNLNPTSGATAIKAIPGLEDTTPGTVPWTVERRNQTYTVALSICSVDDDQDGFGTTTTGNFCTASANTTDRNPDDYKRVVVTVTWTRNGVTRNIKQAGVVNNEASATGPAVEFTSQSPSGEEITSSPSSITFGAQAATGAVAIRFAVDGVLVDTQTSTTATFTWDVDTASVHVPDGTYVVSVTAFNAESVPGPTRSRTIRLNRDLPAAPQDVFGGWNPRADFTDVQNIVEIQWARNTEPDVTGYRVYRKTASGDEVVPGCDKPTEPSFTDCRDVNPPTGATIQYYVKALDENPSTGALREGTASAILTATRATTKPNQPATLTIDEDGDAALLDWADAPDATPPYSGSPVIFYRVYRDGTAIGDRIARTGQDSLTAFRDSEGLTGTHVYYVTSVDSNFSESAPLGPVALP